ncbi:MAG: YfhO family protein [Acidobacteria bacterium]|nr:YfhO family protein [Acidobacteriota bacterium]MBV9475206.1 YfhO family protein [Acidobacteriota bacterium]
MNLTWLYVGIVYALAVAGARRLGADLPKRVAFAFYALVVVLFWLPLTQDYVTTHDDVLKVLPPWAMMTRDYHVINGEMNDVPLQMVPWAHAVREAWRAGHVPLWNATAGSGYPLLANGQSGALSPFRLLALPLSLGHAMTAEGALKVLLALTYAFLLARRRYSRIASAIAAATFGFCGWLAVWLHFPHSSTGCWLPALLFHAELLIERRTPLRFAGASLVWALALFGGHPETAAHAGFIALLYVAWLLFVERVASWRVLLPLGGALCVAALLAAPLLLPMAEAIPRSQRYHLLKERPWKHELPFADLQSAIVMVAPRFFGDVPYERPWGPAAAEPVSGAAGVFRFAAFVAVLIAVIRKRAWRSREAFYLVVSVFLFGILMSWPGLRQLIHAIFPIAANARLRLPLALFLALLSGAAIDEARETRVPLLAGIATVGALLLALLRLTQFPSDFARDSAQLALLPSVLVLAVATVAAITRNDARRTLATSALLAAIAFELFPIAGSWNPPQPARTMRPVTPILAKLRALAPREPFRICGIEGTFFPNLPALYGFEDVRAHDPMANYRYLDFLKLTTGYDYTAYHAQWIEFDTRVFDYLGVRFVLQPRDYPDPARMLLRHDGRDGKLFENPNALPRFFAVRNVILTFDRNAFRAQLAGLAGWNETALLDELKLENAQMGRDFFTPRPANAPLATTRLQRTSDAEYALHVDAPRYTLVASSIPWWPGWKVTRDGKRVAPIRVNGAFVGFAVPSGAHDVRVVYAPDSFRLGVLLAALALSGIAYSIARGRSYRRAPAAA